jgi:cell division septation protein DedD
MTTRTCRLALWLLVLTIPWGCGPGRKAGPAEAPPTGRAMPSEAPENLPSPGAPEAFPLPGEPGEEAQGKRLGYRVQVGAFAQEATARQRAEELRRLFEEPVYVVHEGLLYKIQVGDFVSRDRAEEVRRRAVDLGIEGAFVVDTLIQGD